MEMHERLSALRGRFEYSYGELEGMVGLTKGNLHALHNGQYKAPTHETVLELARVYKTTPEYILQGRVEVDLWAHVARDAEFGDVGWDTPAARARLVLKMASLIYKGHLRLEDVASHFDLDPADLEQALSVDELPDELLSKVAALTQVPMEWLQLGHACWFRQFRWHLADLRRWFAWSQATMATYLGVPLAVYRRDEDIPPTGDILFAYACRLHVGMDWLFGRTTEMWGPTVTQLRSDFASAHRTMMLATPLDRATFLVNWVLAQGGGATFTPTWLAGVCLMDSSSFAELHGRAYGTPGELRPVTASRLAQLLIIPERYIHEGLPESPYPPIGGGSPDIDKTPAE